MFPRYVHRRYLYMIVTVIQEDFQAASRAQKRGAQRCTLGAAREMRLAEGLEARLEEAQIFRLKGHPQPVRVSPLTVDLRHRFGDDIHMRLRIDPSRNRQPD